MAHRRVDLRDTIVRLFYKENLTVPAIADRLGFHKSTVFRALADVRGRADRRPRANERARAAGRGGALAVTADLP